MLRLAAHRHTPVLVGLDDRTVGNACRQHQRHMTRTRRDDGFNLRRRRWRFQQRLKAVGLPCALLLDQPQPLFFVDHVGREDKARDCGGGGSFVERFGLDGQRSRIGFLRQNALVERRGFGWFAFDGGDHDLIVFALMLARQRPDIDRAAVFGEKGSGIFGDVLVVDAPQHQRAVLHPFPSVTQIGELDALVAFRRFVVVIGRIRPEDAEGLLLASSRSTSQRTACVGPKRSIHAAARSPSSSLA